MTTQYRFSRAVVGRSLRCRAQLPTQISASSATRRWVSTTVLWRSSETALMDSSPLKTGSSTIGVPSKNSAPMADFILEPPHQLQIVRWKHAARKGNHLEVLDDMAHSKEREQAQERRKKKKERKEKKKTKGKKDDVSAASDNSNNPVQAALENQMNDFGEDDHDDGDHSDHEDDEVDLPDTGKIKEKMMGIVSSYEESLKAIRGGEPTPEIFEDIVVNAYDSENTPLKAVAQVVITSPTMASVTCFDPALVKEVRNSIQLQLGLNPQADASEGDAGVLKVPLPKVSMETRQKTAAQLNKRAENFRQKIRRVRRRYNNIIKAGKEGKLEGISKDDVFRVAQEIDDVTDQAVKKLNDITDKKHHNIMDV